MKRLDFIKDYAARSGLPDRWAPLGYIDAGSRILVALPCDCGEAECVGWAMMSAEHIDHHLSFYAPEALRNAYAQAKEENGVRG